MNIPWLLCAALSLGASSCTSTLTLQPTGDIAEVRLHTHTKFTGEILAVTDTVLYLVTSPSSDLTDPMMPYDSFRLVSVIPGDILSITIPGDDKNWNSLILAFEVAPSLLLSVAAAEAHQNPLGIFALFSIPTLFTKLWLGADQSGFTIDVTKRPLEDMRKYARYPQGLTAGQIKQLLQGYKQKAVLHAK